MITRFRVQNFKNLADTGYVNFGFLNVIIGPNGCGKSSLLQSIDFLTAFFEPAVQLYLARHQWEYRDLPNLRKQGQTMTWDLDLTIPADGSAAVPGTYSYRVSLSPKRYLTIGEEYLSVQPEAGGERFVLLDRKGRNVQLLNRRTGKLEGQSAFRMPSSIMASLQTASERERYPELFRFREIVQSFRSFLFWDPKVLRGQSKGKRHEIGPSGENLAAVLAYLKESRPQDFARIVGRITKLFPTVSDISIKGGKGWGWKELQLHEDDVIFNSRQISDGVLRLLAMLALRYTEKPPPVLSLEEPENGVHPQLIREVVTLLRELTQRKKPAPCQVFFTTHSPYVLDEFYDSPEQVYVMERGRPQQGAKLCRLSDYNDIDLVKTLYDKSLGEAWFSGVIGGTYAKQRRDA